LLSGANASGKSSVLQALVLLHQTMREHEWSTRLMLNGGAIQLGTALDVVEKVRGRRTFKLGLVEGAPIKDPAVLRYLLPPEVDGEALSLAKRLRGLTYITAERAGPREVYALRDPQNAPVVGPRGEHAVSLLHQGRDEHVIKDLALPEVVPTRLRQVEARMHTLLPRLRAVSAAGAPGKRGDTRPAYFR